MTAAGEHLAVRAEFSHTAEHVFPGTRTAVADVRAWVRDQFTGLRIDVDNAEVAVSELVTNAVLHSRSRGHKFVVWAGHNDTYAQFVIVDAGPLEHAPDGDREGGWGLLLVKNLTDACGWSTHVTGCRIAWFRINLTREA